MTLDNLSNGRRDKWDYFYDMKIREFLHTLSYYKAKQTEHELQVYKQKLKAGR